MRIVEIKKINNQFVIDETNIKEDTAFKYGNEYYISKKKLNNCYVECDFGELHGNETCYFPCIVNCGDKIGNLNYLKKTEAFNILFNNKQGDKMGIILKKVKKEYGREIVRNQTLFNLIDELKDLDEELNNLDLCIKEYEEEGFLEFVLNEFINWYENNKDEKSEAMKELYNSIKNEEANESGYIQFEWY